MKSFFSVFKKKKKTRVQFLESGREKVNFCEIHNLRVYGLSLIGPRKELVDVSVS